MSRSVKNAKSLTRPARRRSAAEPAAQGNRDAARRALCASAFDDPARVTDALHHRVVGRIDAPPHHHADLLQLDVIHACKGQATLGENSTPLHALTLIAVPPGQRHGYALQPESNHAAVWLVKLRVGRNPWPTNAAPFPQLITGLAGHEELRDALAAFVSDWTPSGVGCIALSRFTHAVARWPFSAEPLTTASTTHPSIAAPADSLSARIRDAVETLGHRFDDPPDLDELAAAAEVSARHFARRFRRDFGCTPHAYLAARRLDVARGLLRDADSQISHVADQLGFSSPAAFSRWFTRLAGQSPRAFRNDPRNS